MVGMVCMVVVWDDGWGLVMDCVWMVSIICDVLGVGNWIGGEK